IGRRSYRKSIAFQGHSFGRLLAMNKVQHSRSVAGRGNEMFRAELKQLANGSILKMEGRLVDEWANEARSLVNRGPVPKGLIVDFTEVSYVNGAGEQLLTWLSSFDAIFVAKGVY